MLSARCAGAFCETLRRLPPAGQRNTRAAFRRAQADLQREDPCGARDWHDESAGVRSDRGRAAGAGESPVGRRKRGAATASGRLPGLEVFHTPRRSSLDGVGRGPGQQPFSIRPGRGPRPGEGRSTQIEMGIRIRWRVGGPGAAGRRRRQTLFRQRRRNRLLARREDRMPILDLQGAGDGAHGYFAGVDGAGPLRALFWGYESQRLCSGCADRRRALAIAGGLAPVRAHYGSAGAVGRASLCACIVGGGSARPEREVPVLLVPRQRGRDRYQKRQAALEKLRHSRSAQSDPHQLRRHAAHRSRRRSHLVGAHARPQTQSRLRGHGQQLHRSGRSPHRRHRGVRYGNRRHALVAANDTGRRLEFLLY